MTDRTQKILETVTKNQYNLEPEDIPNEVARIRSVIADALLALADEWREEIDGQPKTEFIFGIKNCIACLTEIVDDLVNYYDT